MGHRVETGRCRAVGIDPGTKSFDVCGIEGDRLFLDNSIPTAEVSSNPRVLADLLRSAAPLDMVVGPSGYGLPWVSTRDLGSREINLMILSSERDRGRTPIIGGMRQILNLLKETQLPIFFVPGVIHLPTVPGQRKVNRIDMGTADKLCAVALGIRDQSHRMKIAYEATSFIYIELGGAFTSIIAVDRGKVVDGLGGTSGPIGYLAVGAMDGELAYLLGNFHKELLSSGGIAYIAGNQELEPEELLAHTRTDARCRLAWEAFMESLVKSVASEMSVVTSPREILISGRLCRSKEISRQVADRLGAFASVNRVTGFARVAKEAAQGAALIAEGMAGGLHESLIEVMGLREAKGTCLDYLYIDKADMLKRRYLGSESNTNF
jgi:predicted butyrate kinase (DUF1464 family)